MKSIISALIFSFITTAAHAGSGTIHFRGSIVEPPCDVRPVDNRRLNVSCFHRGKVVARQVTLHRLNHYAAASDASVAFNVRWLNPQRTRAIVDINYN